METFYLEYHKLVNEVMEFIEPSYVINVHTFDPDVLNSKIQGDILLYTPYPAQSKVLPLLKQALESQAFKLDIRP